jgi:hypothetical protein
MTILFWKIFKLSPVLLGASLLVAGSAYARENASEQTAANSTQVAVVPSTQLPQTQDIARSTVTPQSASAQPEASATSQAARPPQSTTEASVQLPESTVTQPDVAQLTLQETSSDGNSSDRILAQQVPAAHNSNNDVLQQVQQYQENNAETPAEALDQVTNVTQLSDVRPTDWAYEALRSLVERYGCIAGYPDGTYRGNRAMSRYEFAAGVNACLQQIERIIQTSTETFVTKQDLETLQRLTDEFRSELTALGTRVDQLEGRVAFLEDNQFSTTTKLRGEVIFNIADLFGDQAGAQPGSPDYANDEAVFQDRVRLNFDTSFTGKDLLRTRLQARNVIAFGPLAGGNTPGTNVTREGRFGFEGNNGNDIELDRLFYRFPFGDIAQVYLFANNGQYEDFVSLLNPNFESSGSGSLSRFGQYSPIYRMGGQSQGIGVSIGPKAPLRIDLGYLTDVGNNPNEKFGLFDGNYTALGQVSFQPTSALRIAGTYVHSYDRSNLRHGTGSVRSQIQAGNPVVGNSYGLEASFAFSPQLVLSGWGMYTNATVINRGNADIWTYGATLAINDFGSKGSTLGLIAGMEPKLTGSDVRVAQTLARPTGDTAIRRSDRDTGLHFELLYKYKLNNNILITPGVIWLTSPGHDNRNDDIFIGTLRTTFTF